MIKFVLFLLSMPYNQSIGSLMDIDFDLLPVDDDALLEITAPDEHGDIVVTVDGIKQTSEESR